MSTTFGVKIPSTGDTVEVARRVGTKLFWVNDLAILLPNNTPVIPLDNTAQGIYYIGDIKFSIKDYEQSILNNTKTK